MDVFKLVCAIFIVTSAFAQEKITSSCPSPETLAVLMHTLNVNAKPGSAAADELALSMHSMNLRNSAHAISKSKFEKLADLAIKLNTCLIKDEGYFRDIESLAMEYFPKKEPLCDAKTKAELAQLTRDSLKNIVRLTKNISPELPALEYAIHQIPSFNLKYLLHIEGFPVVIEDTTSRYKQEMLATLQK